MCRILSISLVLVLAGCGQAAPPRGTLPEAEIVVPEPQSCVVLIGESLGVAIEEVVADSAADGVLLSGDVLVSVDGEEVTSAMVLREILATRAVGDSVSIVVRRDGDEMSQEVVLGANPDAPDRPMLGVLVTTAFERIPPTELGTGTELDSDFARATSIAGQMYAFDPIAGSWTSLDLATPAQTWAVIGDRILTLENPNTADSALVDHVNGEELLFEVAGWNGSQILGTLDDAIVTAVTRPVEGEADLVQVAVMLVDFIGRTAVWIWPASPELGLPVASFPSPDKSRLLIVGQDQETSEFRHTVLLATGQVQVEGLTSPAGAIALGWYDDESILVGSDLGGLALVDIESDESTVVELPAAIGTIRRAWPVGDGTHLLAETGASLVRFERDGGEEIRTLADNCQLELLGDPGFGG
ncbi:MAG TPA: PDZ domain-containing protein [Acidimicrobiia bacterium]|nr:PDZ domain-containing protein [Acidimicrobiia bacterium]